MSSPSHPKWLLGGGCWYRLRSASMVASASGSASNRERGVILAGVLLLGKKSCSLLDHGQLFDHRFLLELMISFSSSSSRASIARRAEALLGWRNARRMAWRSWANDCRWRPLGAGDLALETRLCLRRRSCLELAYAT